MTDVTNKPFAETLTCFSVMNSENSPMRKRSSLRLRDRDEFQLKKDSKIFNVYIVLSNVIQNLTYLFENVPQRLMQHFA